MSPSIRNWPYAAKAVVQHQWDTNHLNVWVTFRHPMDQTVKPANALWKCEADAVPKNTSASAWQDAWTILLTVDNVLARPDEVTLEYDGPDENLITTWDKQWEPWGPILSLEIPYGWEDIIQIDTANRRVGINVAPSAYTFEIGSLDFSDRISIFHDNTDAHIRWDDGFLILRTDEGTNAQTYVDVKGKGTGYGRLRVFDQDDAEYVYFTAYNGSGFLRVEGDTPVALSLQNDANVPIYMFRNATSGETEEVRIFGFRAGDALRSLDIGVGVDAANCANFDGVDEYRFDGTVRANTAFNCNGLAGLSGTYSFGGGGSGDIATMTFTGGILTGITTVP